MYNFHIFCIFFFLHLIAFSSLFSSSTFFSIYTSLLHPSVRLFFFLFPLPVNHLFFTSTSSIYYYLTTSITRTYSHHIFTILLPLPLTAPHCCVVLGDQIGVVSLWSSDKKIPMLDLKEVFSGKGMFFKNVLQESSSRMLFIISHLFFYSFIYRLSNLFITLSFHSITFFCLFIYF